MSESRNTDGTCGSTPMVHVTPYPQPYQKHHLAPITSPSNLREYRKGNWTLEETLVLITAKKLDDERRIKAATPNSSRATGELRWKWVENYCWSNGCLRSQNQCNDKWDNLLRDYKKVREYELRSSQPELPPYWTMDKTQRKDRNLPSNLLLKIYQELNDVIQIKSSQAPSVPTTDQQPQIAVVPPPLQAPPCAAVSEASDSSETDGDGIEKVDTDTKRRKVRDIGSSIVHSTSILVQTLKSLEEKKEKRHREIMELEAQRLRLEETRNEVNRQGIAGLITSVNNLSSAIQSLISDKP